MKKYCPSPATPTTSTNGPVSLFILKYSPMGSSFGQKRFATAWFTIATGGAASLSEFVNCLPFTSGTCIVSRYEGLMQSYGITGGRSRAGTGCPCTKTGVVLLGKPMVTVKARLVDCTPGILRRTCL